MLYLLRQRNFGLLWFGGLISFTGDWITLIALPVYIYTLTGSVLATGAMWMSSMIPPVLLGSVAGVYVDRWDRRVTMIIANFLSAPLMLILVVVQRPDQIWIIYVATLLKSTVGSFMGPAENALLPRLVGEEHLTTANALNTLNNNLARLIGPAIGGAVLAYLGFRFSVLLDASSFAIAGIMIALINAPRSITRVTTAEGEPAKRETNVLHEWLEGLKLVRGSRLIGALFLLMGVAMIAEGLFEVMIIPYVKDVLRGGSQELGFLFTGQAVGGLVGGVIVGRMSKRLNVANLVGPGLFALGLLELAVFNVPIFYFDILFFVLVGPAVIALETGIQTLLQMNVEDRYMGRVFGAFGTTIALAVLAGQGIASALGGQTGAVPLMTAGGSADSSDGPAHDCFAAEASWATDRLRSRYSASPASPKDDTAHVRRKASNVYPKYVPRRIAGREDMV